MLPSAKRLGILTMFGAAVVVVAAANAQTNTRTQTITTGNNSNVGIRSGPGVLLNDFRNNPIVNNPYNPSLTPGSTCYGYCPSGQAYGCYGSGYGYGGGSYSGNTSCDPLNGFLTGAAAVITSQAQFVVAKRQAQVIDEQSKQAAVDTRRKIYEQWKYEKNDQPTLAQIRREAIEQAYKMDLFHAQRNDIWRGEALNRIFEHAARIQGRGIAGPTINLNEETVKRINFSTGVAGNIGAIKDKGKLEWPSLFLIRPEFAKERDQFSQLAADAYRTGLQNNKVDPGVLQDMDRDLKALEEKLAARIQDEDPTEYLEAKRYLDSLRQAMRILRRSDVARWLGNDFAVKAKTVGELVENMATNGVRFAPARDNEEQFYNALYKALVSYDLGISEKAGSTP